MQVRPLDRRSLVEQNANKIKLKNTNQIRLEVRSLSYMQIITLQNKKTRKEHISVRRTIKAHNGSFDFQKDDK